MHLEAHREETGCTSLSDWQNFPLKANTFPYTDLVLVVKHPHLPMHISAVLSDSSRDNHKSTRATAAMQIKCITDKMWLNP